MQQTTAKIKRPVSIWLWTIYASIVAFFQAIIAVMSLAMQNFWYGITDLLYGVELSGFYFVLYIVIALAFFIGSVRLFKMKRNAPFYLLAWLILNILFTVVASRNIEIAAVSSNLIASVIIKAVFFLISLSFIAWFFYLRKIGVLNGGAPKEAASFRTAPPPEAPYFGAESANAHILPSTIASIASPLRSPPTSPKALSEAQSRQAWSQLSTEMEDGFIDKGLWAQSFAESDGDEIKTKARYMQTRHLAISHELTAQTAQAEAAQIAEAAAREAKRKSELAARESAQKSAYETKRVAEAAAALSRVRTAFETPEKMYALRRCIRAEIIHSNVDDVLLKKFYEETGRHLMLATEKYVDYRIRKLTINEINNYLEQIALRRKNRIIVVTIALGLLGLLLAYNLIII